MSILSYGPKSPGYISDGGCFSCVCTVRKSWLENERSFILHVGGTYLSLFLGKTLCLGTKGGEGGRGDISYVHRLQYVIEMYCNLKDATRLNPKLHLTHSQGPGPYVMSFTWTLKVGLLNCLQWFLLLKCGFLADTLLLTLVSLSFRSFF